MLSNNELSSLDLAGLAAELAKAREELQRMRIEHGLRQLKHTHTIRPQKKYIARVLTFMRAIELEKPITVTKKAPVRKERPAPKKSSAADETSEVQPAETETKPKRAPRKKNTEP